MNRIAKYYLRGRHPKGFWGKRALLAMNGKRHAALPQWALENLEISADASILDVGCGGGANIARLLKMCPNGHVTGIDFSSLAIDMAADVNNNAIVDRECIIVGGNAMQLPLAKAIFDLVIAFETIYYWASIEGGFSEIFRVLKPGGRVLIANERDGLLPEDETLSKTVGGMRIYTQQEIEKTLIQVGFVDITSQRDEQRHFICVTARKP